MTPAWRETIAGNSGASRFENGQAERLRDRRLRIDGGAAKQRLQAGRRKEAGKRDALLDSKLPRPALQKGEPVPGAHHDELGVGALLEHARGRLEKAERALLARQPPPAKRTSGRSCGNASGGAPPSWSIASWMTRILDSATP